MSGEDALRSRLLAFAHELADEADQLTMQSFGTQLEVAAKHDGSPVTDVDRAVERMLRDRIAEAWPDHAVVGEEYGSSGQAEFTWIIDPIDGTKNYMRGVPLWATLLAVQRDDAPVAAVITSPALRSRWEGVAGGGARKNGETIHVSDVARLQEATVSFGGIVWFEPHGGLELIGRITDATARQRAFGDFWHHCLVAEGAIDIALEGDVSPWDLAAVRCIVQAAGGAFVDFDGNNRIDGGTAISATPAVLDELAALIRG